jgi:glycosyltransferase involved in cell wall biosynthesis
MHSRPLEIVMVANTQVSSLSISGGDRVFIEFAKHWSENGQKIRIITCEEGFTMCQRYGLSKVNYVITLMKYDLPIYLLYLLRTFRGTFLASRMKFDKGTVIYSVSDFLTDSIPALFKKLRNKETKWLASTYHFIPHPSKRPGGMAPNNLLSFLSQRISLFFMARWCDMIHTETNFVRDELVKRYRISPEKIFVCQSGIDTKVIDDVLLSKGKIYDACFLARLHKSKGIYDLIAAWKYVCRYNKDAKLAIAGSGPVEVIGELKNRIKDLHLENNVFYLGFLSEEGKYKLLKASKLYVLPSYEEGIPITFGEAMYCGLPIVTYYLPTYLDYKDNIVSVELGDIHSLATEILRILGDDALIHVLGERGRNLAKEHTWDKTANYALSKIESLIE